RGDHARHRAGRRSPCLPAIRRAAGHTSGPPCRHRSGLEGEPMSQYIVRRLLLIIPTLVGVSLLVTGLVRLLPVDAVDILAAGGQVIGGSQALKGMVDERLTARGVDPLKATFADRAKVEDEIVAGQLQKDGINPAGATDAQKQTAKNTVAVAAYKGEIRQK